MAANTTEAIEKLATEIGEHVYIDVAKWHLYLRDAKLHTSLAEQIYPLLEDNRLSEAAVADILTGTSVSLGGGLKTLPLSELVPMAVQRDLLQRLEDYQAEL